MSQCAGIVPKEYPAIHCSPDVLADALKPAIDPFGHSEKYEKVERLLDAFLDAVLEIDPERRASIGIGRNIEGTGHLDLRLTWVCNEH